MTNRQRRKRIQKRERARSRVTEAKKEASDRIEKIQQIVRQSFINPADETLALVEGLASASKQ